MLVSYDMRYVSHDSVRIRGLTRQIIPMYCKRNESPESQWYRWVICVLYRIVSISESQSEPSGVVLSLVYANFLHAKRTLNKPFTKSTCRELRREEWIVITMCLLTIFLLFHLVTTELSREETPSPSWSITCLFTFFIGSFIERWECAS
jgi:hypothetical protein